ncbi:hypothetical protein Tco_0526672 [Tanacetum coccineum]
MSLTQELDKSNLALRYSKIGVSRYKFFHTNHTEKEEVGLKCKEALGLLAENKRKEYVTFCVKKENAKLVNKISKYKRTFSYIKSEKEKMKRDFKDQEDKDNDKQIALENQVKILSNAVYKTSQSAQTVHMLIPKPSLYFNGKCSIIFANHEYLKKVQWEKPCLYKVKYDKHDLANLFAPKSEETIHLAEEIR